MTRRRKRCTGSFIARGNDGRQVRINVFTEFIEVCTTGRDPQDIAGMRELMTSTGDHLNRIEKGRYQVVATGEILASLDPAAF